MSGRRRLPGQLRLVDDYAFRPPRSTTLAASWPIPESLDDWASDNTFNGVRIHGRRGAPPL